MRVILLGPPGAGKGTQAVLLAERLDVPKISTGDLFRHHQEQGTEVGKLVSGIMAKGDLVPDDVTIRMVMDWIDEHRGHGGFLLDGFPRTVVQAEALDAELGESDGVDAAIYINVPQAELVKRLSGRLVCRDCQSQYHAEFAPSKRAGVCDNCGGELHQRDDDKPEAVIKRFQVYLDQTQPVVEHYRAARKIREVSGKGTVEEVGRALAGAVS